MWVRIPPAAPIPSVLRFDCVASPPDVTLCADRRDLGAAYVYLLGLYLGDGYLVEAPKRVWRLRVSLDDDYPAIIARCEAVIAEVSGRTAGRIQRVGCLEIYSNWKHWLCLFPQHGPGPKHARSIRLSAWQESLVAAYPLELVRGLFHSDGCRSINKVRRTWADKSKEYRYPRYFFSNHSPEIAELFIGSCRAIGVSARRNNRYSISVARRESVAILEALVGPKR